MANSVTNIIRFKENPKFPETKVQPTFENMIALANSITVENEFDARNMKEALRRAELRGPDEQIVQLSFGSPYAPYEGLAYEISKVTNYIVHVISSELMLEFHDEFIIDNGEIFEMDGTPQS